MVLTLLCQVSFWPNSWVPLEAIQAVAQDGLHNASFNFSPCLPDSLADFTFQWHIVWIFEIIHPITIMTWTWLDTNLQ